MGMDVYGENPTSEKGTYFRRNVWGWRPLWDYCLENHKDIVEGVSGHSNDGDGLGEGGAKELAYVLRQDIKNGTAKKYVDEFNRIKAKKPKDNVDSWYSLDLEDIEEFAEFLEDCGGFRIC